MNLADLKAPFPAKDVEWRVQKSGKGARGYWAMVLCYVTNRAIMDRLDEVCGPENWRNNFSVGPGGGIMCGISIRVGAGDGALDDWVTKYDGAENTAVEAVKGGFSGAMKRAAVQWGIGRYLYHLEEGWATCYENKKSGQYRAKDKTSGDYFSWDPPALPPWALPLGEPNATASRPEPEPKKKKGTATAAKAIVTKMKNAKTEAELRAADEFQRTLDWGKIDTTNLNDTFQARLSEFHEAGPDFNDVADDF